MCGSKRPSIRLQLSGINFGDCPVPCATYLTLLLFLMCVDPSLVARSLPATLSACCQSARAVGMAGPVQVVPCSCPSWRWIVDSERRSFQLRSRGRSYCLVDIFGSCLYSRSRGEQGKEAVRHVEYAIASRLHSMLAKLGLDLSHLGTRGMASHPD